MYIDMLTNDLVVTRATRSSDTMARYAGDEFVALLDPEADPTVAEQIRDKVD